MTKGVDVSGAFEAVKKEVERATGLKVRLGKESEQRPDCILVKRKDTEGLIHEFCHWVVATPRERERYNLDLKNRWSILREYQACLIEEQIFRWCGFLPERFYNDPFKNARRARRKGVPLRWKGSKLQCKKLAGLVKACQSKKNLQVSRKPVIRKKVRPKGSR
jgi:hypothetical protein